MNLVMIPFHDWKKCEHEGFRTRDAHFMQEFEKHPAVEKLLIINRPISLSEIAIMRRNWQPKSKTRIFQNKSLAINQVSSKTFTLDLLIYEFIKPVRMKRHWTPYIFGHSDLFQAVNKALGLLEICENYNLFTSAPLYVPLIKQLIPQCFAFDAQDNLLKQSFYRDLPNLEAYYQYCIQNADVISANSQETTQWFLEHRSDAMHIPNGVDGHMFDPNQDYSMPQDLAGIPKPIIGYAGKMQEMFDVPLMLNLVANFPNFQFVFVGQQLNASWMKPLWEFKNAHYLGDKAYHELPQYLAAFDVCIIPYYLTKQHGGDPIKFYEYLAMGKPVITTNIGNVQAFQDYPQVCIADSPEEFISGVTGFIQEKQNSRLVEQRPLPASAFWSTKADQIITMMSTHGSQTN